MNEFHFIFYSFYLQKLLFAVRHLFLNEQIEVV